MLFNNHGGIIFHSISPQSFESSVWCVCVYISWAVLPPWLKQSTAASQDPFHPDQQLCCFLDKQSRGGTPLTLQSHRAPSPTSKCTRHAGAALDSPGPARESEGSENLTSLTTFLSSLLCKHQSPTHKVLYWLGMAIQKSIFICIIFSTTYPGYH